MKKLLIIIAASSFCCNALAQDDTQKAAAEAAAAFAAAPEEEVAVAKVSYWKAASAFDIGLSQSSLTNWAAGGFNTITLSSGIDAKADYARNLTSWTNRLQLQYGFIWTKDKPNVLQKSNDRIYLESRFAYKTGKESKWNYTASFDFRSQFSNTYNKYTQDASGAWEATGLKSGFISPAYTNVALGMEWKPSDWFDINVAPLSGGFTICMEESLRKSYGMPIIDETLGTYGYALFQLGAQIKMNAKFTINDVFRFETQLVLFTDYLNAPFRQNRINWDNKITWQLAKFFNIGLSTWAIYDPIVEIDGRRSAIQFKEFLAFNFSYTLGGKK